MDIKNWSTSAGGNTSSSPDGFPEGMAPSGVNDAARELMAAVRRQMESAEWFDYGHTPTYVNASSFTLAGDKTTIYHADRRLRLADTSVLYGSIASASYSTVTRVSLSLDSGALTASLTGVAVAILSATNKSMPGQYAAYDLTGTWSASHRFLASLDVSATLSAAGVVAATGRFVDTLSAGAAAMTSLRVDATASISLLISTRVMLNSEPSATAQATTKLYVDTKASVATRLTSYAAATAPGTVVAISAGVTIDTGFAAGTVFSIYNNSASAITLTQGSGLTLRLAGTTQTGNRTLAPRGLATLWANGTAEYVLTGAGLT